MTNDNSSQTKSTIPDPYGIFAAFPELNFPFWEQLVIRDWLLDDSDHKNLLKLDMWDFWEAAFWYIFKKPPCAAFKPEDISGFIMKASSLAEKFEMDAETLWDQFQDLLRIYDRSIRAAAAEILHATIMIQKEFIAPSAFIDWANKHFVKTNKRVLTKEKKDEIRKQSYQKIKQFAKTQDPPIPMKELIEFLEIRDFAAMYIYLAPRGNKEAGLRSLLDRLRKDPEIPKILPGKQIRKLNKEHDFF